MSGKNDGSNFKKNSDDIFLALGEDDLFLSEEERLASNEIQEIQNKLDSALSANEISSLLTRLKKAYRRFLESAKLVENNNDKMRKELYEVKTDEAKKKDKNQIDDVLQTLKQLAGKL